MISWLLGILFFVHGDLSLQHVNKKDPELLQRGGLSGGATSADSKKIYPIDVSKTTVDSVMYVYILLISLKQ